MTGLFQEKEHAVGRAGDSGGAKGSQVRLYCSRAVNFIDYNLSPNYLFKFLNLIACVLLVNL